MRRELRTAEPNVLRQQRDPSRGHVEGAGVEGHPPGEDAEQGRLPRPVRPGDEKVVTSADVQPVEAQPIAHVQVAPGDRRHSAVCPGERLRERQRPWWLGDRVTQQIVDPALGVSYPAADRCLHVGALELVDELVAVLRRPVVRHLSGSGLRRAAKGGQLVLLVGERLLPAASRGSLVREVRREAEGRPVAARPVDAEVGCIEVDNLGTHPVEQDPVMAGDDDNAGKRTRNCWRNSIAASSRWLVGSSRMRHPGCRVIRAAVARRVRSPPDSVATRRSGDRPESPSRADASSARLRAPQASCCSAQARVRAYSSAASGWSSSPGEPFEPEYGVVQWGERLGKRVGDRRLPAQIGLLLTGSRGRVAGSHRRSRGLRRQPGGAAASTCLRRSRR